MSIVIRLTWRPGCKSYAQETDSDLLAASRLIGALYATMGDFSSFTAVSLLYFAAVSFAETAHRLGKPELAPGFLLHRHPFVWAGVAALVGASVQTG